MLLEAGDGAYNYAWYHVYSLNPVLLTNILLTARNPPVSWLRAVLMFTGSSPDSAACRTGMEFAMLSCKATITIQQM